MPQIQLHGISNCDTVKKAKAWLNDRAIDYKFVDFRKDGIATDDVRRWISLAGADKILNKRGTTWRKLSAEQQQIDSDEQLIDLLCQQPALIKRPVLELSNDRVEIGFKPELYITIFAP